MRALLVGFVVIGVMASPAPAAAGNGTTLLPFVAEDAEVVAVIDVADCRDELMFQQGADSIFSRAGDLKAMMALAGIDAMRDVDTVLIAGRYGPTGNLYDFNQQLVVIIEGGFTRKQVTKLLAGATTAKHRSVKYWVSGGYELALIGKRLFATSRGGMPALIDRSKKKAKGLMKSSKAALLRAAVTGTDMRHDAWMAGVMPATTASAMRSMGFEGEAFSVGVTLETDMTVELRIRTPDAAMATDLTALVATQLETLEQLAEQFGLAALGASLAVTQDDRVVDVDAVVSEAELFTVVQFITML